MEKTIEQIVTVLFQAFGKGGDVARQKIYCIVLKSIHPVLAEKAVYKVIAEWDQFTVPPVAVVLQAAKSLYSAKVPETKVKTWDEAWTEINAAMYSTPWGKTPEWSTKEIKAAVDAFGWKTLHGIDSKDFNTARAQIRVFYEAACKRFAEEAVNAFVMGENAKGILGIPKNDSNALQGISAQNRRGLDNGAL